MVNIIMVPGMRERFLHLCHGIEFNANIMCDNKIKQKKIYYISNHLLMKLTIN